MKGPFERLKYELRRIWECPKCHRRVKTAGSQTSMFCRCSEGDPAVSMSLVGDGARRLVPPVVLVHDPIVLSSNPVHEIAAASIADPANPSSEPSVESPASQSPPDPPPPPPPSLADDSVSS